MNGTNSGLTSIDDDDKRTLDEMSQMTDKQGVDVNTTNDVQELRIEKVSNLSPETRKYKSRLLIHGDVRQSCDIFIPLPIIDLFVAYYHEPFQPKWSREFKGDHMQLDEDDTKVTLEDSRHECCRGRDPITKGMVVEWTANCYIINGMCLGVVSSQTKDFNDSAYRGLMNAYGIDDCPDMFYYGAKKRHVDIEDEYDADNQWHKPRIEHRNSEINVKIVCDYQNEQATLTYYFDGKVSKPPNEEYTFELPLLEQSECWYMAVDVWCADSWVKIK